MSENQEENKPVRKTVTILKKAYPVTTFTSNIFPSMTGNSFTDTLGTWTISSCGNHSSWHPAYHAIDGDDTTYWESKQMYGDEQWIIINAPDNIGICPSKFAFRVSGTSTLDNKPNTVQGWNPTTEAWDTLISIKGYRWTQTKELEVSTSIYYTKFRFASCRNNNADESRSLLYYFKCTAGSWRKLK